MAKTALGPVIRTHQTALDTLPRLSFGGIEFPYESIEIEGSIRDHVHEYPHTPGGAPEKMGRRLNMIRVQATFSTRFAKYPDLWPLQLDRLIKLFETESTEDLVVPSRNATVRAYCTKWTTRLEVRMRNGEKVTLEFREDQSGDFLTPALVNVSDQATIADRSAELDAQLIAINFSYRNKREKDLFDSIRSLSNTIAAIGDQADLAAGILDARLAQLAQLCAVADQLPQLGGAEAWPAINALQALWMAAVKMREDTLQKGAPLHDAVVPYTMSAGEVSTWLYGDTTHVGELLSLNASITDAARVLAGTRVRYYLADRAGT